MEDLKSKDLAEILKNIREEFEKLNEEIIYQILEGVFRDLNNERQRIRSVLSRLIAQVLSRIEANQVLTATNLFTRFIEEIQPVIQGDNIIEITLNVKCRLEQLIGEINGEILGNFDQLAVSIIKNLAIIDPNLVEAITFLFNDEFSNREWFLVQAQLSKIILFLKQRHMPNRKIAEHADINSGYFSQLFSIDNKKPSDAIKIKLIKALREILQELSRSNISK